MQTLEEMGIPHQVHKHPLSETTRSVMEHNLQVFDREGMDAMMADYAEDAVIISPYTIFRGHDEIRRFYTTFMHKTPKGFLEAVVTKSMTIVGEIAYIQWEAQPWTSLSTATFVILEGKITYQTMVPKSNSAEVDQIYRKQQ
ncbi:MAG: nuclear transport factor 2 family protein [Chloroflexota bacterium]